jgi:hypothetical protein
VLVLRIVVRTVEAVMGLVFWGLDGWIMVEAERVRFAEEWGIEGVSRVFCGDGMGVVIIVVGVWGFCELGGQLSFEKIWLRVIECNLGWCYVMLDKW